MMTGGIPISGNLHVPCRTVAMLGYETNHASVMRIYWVLSLEYLRDTPRKMKALRNGWKTAVYPLEVAQGQSVNHGMVWNDCRVPKMGVPQSSSIVAGFFMK